MSTKGMDVAETSSEDEQKQIEAPDQPQQATPGRMGGKSRHKRAPKGRSSTSRGKGSSSSKSSKKRRASHRRKKAKASDEESEESEGPVVTTPSSKVRGSGAGVGVSTHWGWQRRRKKEGDDELAKMHRKAEKLDDKYVWPTEVRSLFLSFFLSSTYPKHCDRHRLAPRSILNIFRSFLNIFSKGVRMLAAVLRQRRGEESLRHRPRRHDGGDAVPQADHAVAVPQDDADRQPRVVPHALQRAVAGEPEPAAEGAVHAAAQPPVHEEPAGAFTLIPFGSPQEI